MQWVGVVGLVCCVGVAMWQVGVMMGLACCGGACVRQVGIMVGLARYIGVVLWQGFHGAGWR